MKPPAPSEPGAPYAQTATEMPLPRGRSRWVGGLTSCPVASQLGNAADFLLNHHGAGVCVSQSGGDISAL